jgi:hypothetical protein
MVHVEINGTPLEVPRYSTVSYELADGGILV